jgi:NAD(P)-dependent dehydrogenase (short-subunit alcohol dehydrogenase family)
MSTERQVAFVTGAGKGIGRAIAIGLAQDGMLVVVADLDLPSAERVSDEIRALGNTNMALGVDVRDRNQVDHAIAGTLSSFGRVDVLVNNAGITGRAIPVVEMTDKDWLDVLAVDLNGVFFCTRSVLSHMIQEGRGRIVNIASIAGKEGNPNMAAYSAAKAAVIAFTKAVAKEVAHAGVFVHCVAPGVIETELLDQLTPEQVKYLLDRVPLGRFGRPEEVASLVRFLVSENFTFSTGACFDLSGGRAVY